MERLGPQAVVLDENENKLKTPENSVPEEETVLSQAAMPFFVNHWVTEYRNQLVGWCIYHDIHVDKNAPIRQAAVARLEKRV